MHKFAGWLLSALLLALPTSALALEVLIPPSGSVLKEGKVRIIGLESNAQKVKVEFDGQATTVRVKDGKFFVAVNLGDGAQKVKLSAGDQMVELSLTIDPAAGDGRFVYHDEVEEGKCQACHDENGCPPSGSDVSDICQRCHSRYDEKRYVHGPVAMGLCSACHDPHGSSRPANIRYDVLDLCQDCHNEPITREHAERSGGKVCTLCHDPHQGDDAFQVEKK